MKKYLKWVILTGGVLMFSLLTIFSIKAKVSAEICEKIKEQSEMIFSAFLVTENDSGTFFYNLETDRIYKDSNNIFKEMYYNDDKTRFIAKIEDDTYSGFIGIIEYDIEKRISIPILSLDDMRRLFNDPELVLDNVFAPKYYTLLDEVHPPEGACIAGCPDGYENGYSLVYQKKLYILKEEDNEWKINSVYEVPEQDILGSYAWDKNGESVYVRIITGDDKWELIRYNIKTKESIRLLENVAAFELSPDGNQIVYDELDKKKIYLYDIQKKESVLLAKHKSSLLAENPIMFSDKGDMVLYVEVTYGAIDRKSMYKFGVIDLETGGVKEVKDWKGTVTLYGMNW